MDRNKILPIEIKYSKIDSKAIKIFMKKFKLNSGIILTYDTEEKISFKEKQINVLPFYRYLLKKKVKI